MENYIVSARKYRPLTFDTVVGQKALTQTLQNAIRQNRLAHAYLFCGPRGVGKTTCARIFAKTINCLNPNADYDACNECESCRAFNEQRSFNIHELDAASNNSVEDIRNLIDETRIPPQIGKYSVYIVDEVHMLSTGAFNALLKTLEEPPSYVIFILATTEKHKVPATILSRCQIYDFSRITVADTIAHLQSVASKEGITVSEESLNVVAQKADGGMRDALSIFDQLVSFCGNNISYEQTIAVLNVLDTDYYFRLVDMALQHDVTNSLLLLNDVLQKGFDAGNFITGLAQHLRDVLVAKDPQTIILLETSDSIRKHYAEQAQHCYPQWLFAALDILNTCDINYRTAKNKRLTVEIALIKLCQLGVNNVAIQQENAPSAAIKTQPVKSPVVEQSKTVQQPVHTDSPSGSYSARPSAPKTLPTIPGSMPSMPTIPRVPSVGSSQSTSVEDKKDEKATPVAQQNNPFTVDQFNDAWTGLTKSFTEEPRLYSLLTDYRPILKDATHAVMTLPNPWQRDEVKSHITEFISKLRTVLHNDNLSIDVELAEYDHVQTAITAEERYKVMTENNPQVRELKNALNLLID